MPTSNNLSASDKPAVTNEHLQKYEEIMKTGTLNTGAPVLPTDTSTPTPKPQQGKIAAMLAALPKAKGIGNKMFIFNGKKKIIMDGGEKEEENAKTVDAKEIKKLQKEEEKKDEETLAAPPPPVKVEEDIETERKLEKKNGKKEEEKKEVKAEKEEKKEKKGSSQEVPKGLIIGGIALLILWTAGWAYFLGYFSLLGL